VMDEPTTALDVVVQAEILDELARLRSQMGFSVLLVSHDLPLMLERCDRISVMYAGRIVETAPVEVFRQRPSHPYAQHLLDSFPRIDGPRVLHKGLSGSPPSLSSPPPGCRAQSSPALTQLGPGHVAACHLLTQSAAPVGASVVH
jgi:peptide/nickel transport system ATP-binding protein